MYMHVKYSIVCAVCMVVCTCESEWMNVLNQEEDTAIFSWPAKGSTLPNGSWGMFFCVLLLVCSVTLNVVWCIWKWHYSAPALLRFLFWWVIMKPSGNLYLLFTRTNTHICFILTSSGRIQRATVSMMDIRRHAACIISAGHSVTLLSSVFVLLSSVIWVLLKQTVPEFIVCLHILKVLPPAWFLWHTTFYGIHLGT